MLQRRDLPTTSQAFLLAVEVQEGGPTVQQLVNALSDAVRFIEGTGETDVTPLGLLDEYEGDPR